MIVKPKDAATIILIRPSRNAAKGVIEVLMVLRHPGNRFAADAYVFPGGAIDDQDCLASLEPYCTGLNPNTAAKIITDIPSPGLAQGAWIAAVRETFEEVGLLLAYDSQKRLLSLTPESDKIARFDRYRRQLNDSSITLKDILEKERLVLATDRIFYYSHWITPELVPIRYDVRFFVAQAPPDQEPLHDGFELTDSLWITPQKALQANREGRFTMVLPTIVTMKELAQFRSAEDVIQSTYKKNVPKILTTLVKKDSTLVEAMPDGSIVGPAPVLMK